jgi:hypothetical protein
LAGHVGERLVLELGRICAAFAAQVTAIQPLLRDALELPEKVELRIFARPPLGQDEVRRQLVEDLGRPHLPRVHQVQVDLSANDPRVSSLEQRLKEIVAHYTKSAPKLATWLEENVPQGFTVFTLSVAHQRRMRTSDPLERVNHELKRRTRVAHVFPNEKSLLRLISVLLAEISDDWETGKIHLNVENQNPPSV